MTTAANIKPDYQITANDADITAIVRERFISLTLTDEAGTESDTLEIHLADNNPQKPLALPPRGALLKLHMGYDDKLDFMGAFVVDDLEVGGGTGAVAEMVITAKAAVQEDTPQGNTTLRTQKSRSWPAQKLADIVSAIAKDHGLSGAVSPDLTGVELPHTSQTNESDIHFLNRIAKRFDAVVKPANGKLIVAKIGGSTSLSGQALPVITLYPHDCTNWRVKLSSRETAGQVTAYYHDLSSAKRKSVQVGKGDRHHRLKVQYPTEEMALAAARSDLDRRERGEKTLSLTLPGRTDLAAESRLMLIGFYQDGVSGEWLIKRVTHTLDDSGYVCSIEGEAPNAGGEKPVSIINEVDDNASQ